MLLGTIVGIWLLAALVLSVLEYRSRRRRRNIVRGDGEVKLTGHCHRCGDPKHVHTEDELDHCHGYGVKGDH